MIAMRYGAVPIVRETGGLKDTVHAYEAWNGAGNGFSFTNYNAGDMCYVIGEAVDLYHQKPEAYTGSAQARHGRGFQLGAQREKIPRNLRFHLQIR